MVAFSVALAVAASVLTYTSVRYARGPRRRLALGLALALFSGGLYIGVGRGGFWTGFYSLLAVYFLSCILLPWLALWYRQRHGQASAR